MAIKTRRKRYTGPSTVDRVDWQRHLTQPQARILIEYMGFSPPNGMAPKVEMLKELLEHDKERLQKGFEVIVMGKIPEDTPAPAAAQGSTTITPESMADAMKKLRGEVTDKAAEMISGAIGEQTDMVLRSKVDELTKNIEKLAKVELQKAAADYKPIVVKTGAKKKVLKGVLPAEFERMIQLGSQRKNILLVGPAGCGKTYLAGKLAEALSITRYGDQSMSEGVTEADFTGRLLPIGKDGAFEHVSTPFLDCYEKGGVFLFDEMDNGDPNLLVFLNKALANESIFVPSRYKKPEVKKHKDFIAIGAANTFGHGSDAMYVGRNPLDAATLDRFRTGIINLDYSEKVERSLAREDVFDWCTKVRKAIRKNSLHKIMSTRSMIDLTDMAVNCDWKEKDWADAFFADWDDNEKSLVMDSLAPDLSDFARSAGDHKF